MKLLHLARVDSTSTELRRRASAEPDEWSHLAALIADEQTDGRGRLGRGWRTPPGEALTASVLLRPRVAPQWLGWITLLSGLALTRAVAALPGAEQLLVGTKWPNDVLVATGEPLAGWGAARKVAGILSEVLPAPAHASPPAVIVGIGLNLQQRPADLPVPWAASLRSVGLVAPAAPVVLRAVLDELGALLERWQADGGGRPPALLRDEVRGSCWTLGRDVRVELPGGAQQQGRAEDIDDDGHLVLTGADGRRHVVLAGDVAHVRDAGAATGIASEP